MPPTLPDAILGGFVICRPKPIPVGQHTEVGHWLMSDLHIGASHVDYKLIEKELKDAKKRGDRILINGDLWDLILVKDHKRFSADVIHPRLQGRNDIVNEAVDWAAEMLEPYASSIDMIGIGNHESTVIKYHNTDPTKSLIGILTHGMSKEERQGHIIHYGGYTGFVDYRYEWRNQQGKKRGNDEGRAAGGRRWVLYYHHGSGGAAPVTKGMIDFNRKDTFINADMIWMGHKHQRLNVSMEKLSCPLQGFDVTVSEVRHVMTGGYFKTYVGQSQKSIMTHGRRSNYAADAGMGPGGKGGARVVLTFSSNRPPLIRVEQ